MFSRVIDYRPDNLNHPKTINNLKLFAQKIRVARLTVLKITKNNIMKELKIGVIGLGNVGSGVYEILNSDIAMINKRSKTPLKLVAVSSRTKKDFVDEKKVKFYANPLDLVNDKDIDVVVELIGGETIAYQIIVEALNNKKHVVTANKALIASKGVELDNLATKNDVTFAFESSVAGGIPIIKSIREGLAANKISKIYGILNGTCNYILTKMEENNADFSVALKEAQDLGYAEADPTFDVEGIDTAHKLAILAAIAKNSKIDFEVIYIEGITKISIDDINFARELGYRIKLLGIYQDFGGATKQAIHPCLIKSSEKIANVNNSYNAVLALGNNSDWNLSVGRGAGSKPTASAVVADLIDIGSGRKSFAFGVPANDLIDVKVNKIEERVGEYYIRFVANKEFAKNSGFVKEVFGDLIEKSVVKELGDEALLYGLKTKSVDEKKFNEILKKLSGFKEISEINRIRIEEIGSNL
jgi:homoserine dehydrogenase